MWLHPDALDKILTFVFANNEVYKVLTPGKSISPFLFGGEIYFWDSLLKVPIDIHALDLFLAGNYQALVNSAFDQYIPWQVFDEGESRVADSDVLELPDKEKQKNDLMYTTKLLKLYKDYKKENQANCIK